LIDSSKKWFVGSLKLDSLRRMPWALLGSFSLPPALARTQYDFREEMVRTGFLF
jgi:hypothetical protein